MQKDRLIAFSDAVLAVVITIMVLEFKAPREPTLVALTAQAPTFVAYVLSFIYIGIYWNNHHHMMHATEHINGRVLWANLFLLFWITLVPFTTAWMSENRFASITVTVYGFVLLMASFGFLLLQREILLCNGPQSRVARALGRDAKGKLSSLLYIIALVAAAWLPWFSCLLYAIVAVIWLVPDRRFEKVLSE